MKKKFTSTDEGIHLMSPDNGDEYTLCGIAFDAYYSEKDPGLEHKETDSKIVTCKKCIAIIKTCRNVKIKEQS